MGQQSGPGAGVGFDESTGDREGDCGADEELCPDGEWPHKFHGDEIDGQRVDVPGADAGLEEESCRIPESVFGFALPGDHVECENPEDGSQDVQPEERAGPVPQLP